MQPHVAQPGVTDTSVTSAAVNFIAAGRRRPLPAAMREMAIRCIRDTTGLYVAGLSEEAVRILVAQAIHDGGRADSLLLGTDARVPATIAARVLGVAAHAHDFDDTQVSHDPAHVYGLLTHPSAAPLSATIAVGDTVGPISGEEFLAAFCTGFEVSCKISEWLRPDHYLRGHHSSGTVATFGAAAAAAVLLGLTEREIASALGIAASFAAGIRCNFGTMTKPLHVGRAAENGVLAATLAKRGFRADAAALDGRWGFASVLAGGYAEEKLAQGFGQTWSMLDPGVSIKPYPSGILTHQSMDMVLSLVREHDIAPEAVERIDFYAGDNILNPIRYAVAVDGLQAKFSMQALIAMLVLYRSAGLAEFEDSVIQLPAFQQMQRRIATHRDPEINAAGFDIIRSRVTFTLKDGRAVSGTADPRYRGGPAYPLTDAELDDKVRACAHLLSPAAQDELIRSIHTLAEPGSSAAGFLNALRSVRVPGMGAE